MLTPQQRNHFHTFGYQLLRRAFDVREMAAITRVVEQAWAEDPAPLVHEEWRTSGIVERRPELTRLVTDDRVYPVIEQLLGPDPLWVGSEGNISRKTTVGWHPDRRATEVAKSTGWTSPRSR